MSEISILYGLGNPDEDFQDTRHNIGYETLDLLARRNGLRWRTAPGPVLEAVLDLEVKRVHLLKPQVFMNLSGRPLLRIDYIDPGSLLVICDDINLPLGMLRIREKGGSGGHKGLESIIDRLATEDFARLRMGIGAPPPDEGWSEYVLAPFPPDELAEVRTMIETAADALDTVIRRGLSAAMQIYNKKEITSNGK